MAAVPAIQYILANCIRTTSAKNIACWPQLPYVLVAEAAVFM